MFQTIGLPGLLIILVAIVVLFGRGRVASLMGEVGQGIASFRTSLRDDDTPRDPPTA